MSEALEHSLDHSEFWSRFTFFERGAISSDSGSLGLEADTKQPRSAVREQGRSRNRFAIVNSTLRTSHFLVDSQHF